VKNHICGQKNKSGEYWRLYQPSKKVEKKAKIKENGKILAILEIFSTLVNI